MSVRAECQRGHGLIAVSHPDDFLSGPLVPDVSPAIAVAADQGAAVRAERDDIDMAGDVGLQRFQ